MDMNVVMYPEITGDNKPKQSDNDPNRYNANALADILTLNYAMLKSPINTSLPKNNWQILQSDIVNYLVVRTL